MGVDFSNTMYLIGRKQQKEAIDARVAMVIEKLGATRVDEELYVVTLDGSGKYESPLRLFSYSSLDGVVSVVVSTNDGSEANLILAASCRGVGFEAEFDERDFDRDVDQNCGMRELGSARVYFKNDSSEMVTGPQEPQNGEQGTQQDPEVQGTVQDE